MTEEKLESYLEQIVQVMLCDATIHVGMLHYSGEYIDRHGWKHDNYFFIGQRRFKAKQVTQIWVVRE